MSALSAPRLKRELLEQRKLAANPELAAKQQPGIILDAPDPDNIYKWTAVIDGVSKTPFEGGRFKVIIKVPSDYPMAAPTAAFETKIFHPNVKWTTGEICLDILKDRWSPAWTMVALCSAIQNLMSDASGADSPLNCDAGNLVRAKDMKAFEDLARHYAVLYAGAKAPSW